MALLRPSAALAIACLSSCADAPAGELVVAYGTSPDEAEEQRGFMFVSEGSSRFEGGLLLYGEVQPRPGTLGILELDLPSAPEETPSLRYQERRGRQITFDGEAVAGRIRVNLGPDAEDCGCRAVDFALSFEDGSRLRRFHTGHLGVDQARCEDAVVLDAADAPVVTQRVDRCGARVRVEPAARPPERAPQPPPARDDDSAGCASNDYEEEDSVIAAGCASGSDGSGCASSEDDDYESGCTVETGRDDQGSEGCEDDSSETSGCEGDESSDASADGCAGDDVDEASACAVVRSPQSGRWLRPRLVGRWSPRYNDALLLWLSLAWLRFRARLRGSAL
jgi:hypothetical protein